VIILLAGGTKKGQAIDIARAKTLWAGYKTRKAAAKPKGKR
jgi:putative component of toxin-antitoxin plasmid stabilization module